MKRNRPVTMVAELTGHNLAANLDPVKLESPVYGLISAFLPFPVSIGVTITTAISSAKKSVITINY